MPIDTAAVGSRAEPFSRTWSETDAILYALGVGAGRADPAAELEFTTENSRDVPQRVLPAFAIPLLQAGLGKRIPFGDYPRGALVHAEQALVVHRPLSPSGSMRVSARITGIHDKGSGALVRMEAAGTDPDSGDALATSRLGYFVRGCGGFGGPPAPADAWEEPAGEPDLVISTATRPDQALLYRLSGDRNPLHSDPKFAAAAGFSRPILHGLCTYGVVSRELARVLCDADPVRFGAISARFSKPLYPGEALTIPVWVRDGTASFRAATDTGRVVLDRGTFSWKPSSGRPGGADTVAA